MKYFIFTLLLLSGICSSCKQEEEETDNEYIDLQFVPRIESTSITTRTPQVGGLAIGTNMGLSILPRDAYEKNSPRIDLDLCDRYSPAPQYRRIKVTNYSGKYSYLPVDTKESASSLPIKRTGGTLDVYAWLPYDTDFQRFEAIPFKVDQQLQNNIDYMISTNGVIQLDPLNATGNDNKYVLSIPVNLKHIMTQLEFNFDISYAGPDLLPYLGIKTTTDRIHLTGTYSFYDGGITPATSSDTITFIGNYINVNTQNSSGGKVQGFILPAIEVGADSEEKMKISLKFNAAQPVPIQKGPLEFNLRDLQVTDKDGKTRYGLIEGYKYVIHIKVDNFVKYSGIPSVKAWGETSLEIPI